MPLDAPYIEQQIKKPDSKLYRLGQMAATGGNIADEASTIQAMTSGRGKEANPIMGQGLGKQVALKSAGTLAELLIMHHLAKTHPNIAAGLGFGIGALGTGIAIHNSKVGR